MSSSEGDFVMPGAADVPVGFPAGAESDSSGDFVMPGQAGGGAASSGSDDIVMGGVAGPRRRNRQPAPLQSSGVFWMVAVANQTVDGVRGFFVLGVVELQWQLASAGNDVAEQGLRGGICGTVTYTCRSSILLDDPVVLPDVLDIGTEVGWLQALEIVGPSLCSNGSDTITGFMSRRNVRCEAQLLACDDAEAETVLQVGELGAPRMFRAVRIYKRWADPSRIISKFPSASTLRRWRKGQQREQDAHNSDDAQDPPPEAELASSWLFVPPQHFGRSNIPSLSTRPTLRREIDPVRLVRAIGLVRHLRSPKLFEEALDDSLAYLFQDREVVPGRDKSVDPKRTSLQCALSRADVVCMLVTRRLFQKWRHEDCLKCVNVYSDASPVVGTELQGMLLDLVFKDGTLTRLVLPGSTLAYGHTGTIDKGVALLWAFWLVAGPTVEDLTWVFGKVTSFTTDFGVEMHLLDMPDITEAFVAWAGGRPLDQVRFLVKPDRRLFPRALRLAGWSHMMGNIMKTVAEKFPSWPSSLGKMRALCKFYKNNTYRQHIRRKMAFDEPALDSSLKSFTAGFAKWRYETVYEVERQLLRVRAVSAHLSPALFAHAQDQAEISSVFNACKDLAFWRWLAASFNKIFASLEYLRRWGMVCECPGHQEARRRGRADGRSQFIKCPRTVLLASLILIWKFLCF